MGVIPEMKAKTNSTLTEDPYHAYTGKCDSRRSKIGAQCYVARKSSY